MKKTSILIAMFAVITAASIGSAAELVDFDGKLKPQSMHDIFTSGHNIIPASVTQDLPMPKAPEMQAENTPRTVMFMSHKAKLAQIEMLKNINAKLIRDQKLALLLENSGTEVLFQGNSVIYVINADMKARFTIRDTNVFDAVYNVRPGNQRFDPIDLVAIGIVEVAHIVTDSIQEYGSWPPIPDSGNANDYHGPALTVDQNGLQSYPSRKADK